MYYIEYDICPTFLFTIHKINYNEVYKEYLQSYKRYKGHKITSKLVKPLIC